jgi:transcriptional regulator with XRE-family HTH domain
MKIENIEGMEQIHQYLGQNLRQRRKSLKLTQEAFAQRCGLHRTYVGAIERGERNITLSTLASIAAALNVQPQKLIKVPKS